MKICQICMDGRIGMYMDGRVSHHLHVYLLNSYKYLPKCAVRKTLYLHQWLSRSDQINQIKILKQSSNFNFCKNC